LSSPYMPSQIRFLGISFFICCLLLAPARAGSAVEQGAHAVIRSQQQWETMLKSGETTPLDALTPYGKRRFIASMSWGRAGLGGFGFGPLIRELDADQLSDVLTFLDSADYLKYLRDQLVGAQLRLPAPSLDAEQRLVDLETFAKLEIEKNRDIIPSSTARGGSTLLRRYEDLFGGQSRLSVLQRQPTADLPLLFDAAALAARETSESTAFADMLEIHREMAARGIDTRRSFDDSVLTALMAAREFKKARMFASSRPHLASREIPIVVDLLGSSFKGRTVLEYDRINKTLTRRALPYPIGTELVMVVDAGCHFSRDALNAIRNDAELQLRLRKANLLLVTPPRSPISTSFLGDWNEANPSMPIYVPFNTKEWEAFDVAGVPEFFLLRNGALVEQLRSGWPAKGNKAALVKLLESPVK
jgi:hypothetical protein